MESASASGGGATSHVGDSLESNPATLPIINAPLGLEGTWSDRSFPAGKRKVSGSTVKGFDGVGFGLGSWSEDTFTAPDFSNHFLSSSSLAEYKKYVANPPSSIGLRLGTSIALPRGPLPKGVLLSVGGSLGFGRVAKTYSPQVGVLLRVAGLGIGYSSNFERISVLLPLITISTFAVGAQLGGFYLGYSYFTLKSSVNRTFANVYGLRFSTSKLTLYGNIKYQKDQRGAPDAWVRAGLLRRVGRHFGAGYEYGLYRNSHSAIFQIFL